VTFSFVVLFWATSLQTHSSSYALKTDKVTYSPIRRLPITQTVYQFESQTMSTRWAIPNKLRQLQYRSYIYELTIYHYPHHLIPLRLFEARLTRVQHGFIARLVSDDPIAHISRPEGDEVPDGCYEVAYLKNVFQNRGSALGFRIAGAQEEGEKSIGKEAGDGKIEWLCFERGIQPELSSWSVLQTPGRKDSEIDLFDEVGILSKAEVLKKGTVTGHVEHRAWYEALEQAWHPKVKLTLTYKNKRRDQLEEWDRMRAARAGSLGVADMAILDADGDYDSSDKHTEGEKGVGDERDDGPLTPDSAPVRKPMVVERSRMDRQAAGEYV